MCLQLTGGFSQGWKVNLINCFQQSGSFKSDHTLADVVGLSSRKLRLWDCRKYTTHYTHLTLPRHNYCCYISLAAFISSRNATSSYCFESDHCPPVGTVIFCLSCVWIFMSFLGPLFWPSYSAKFMSCHCLDLIVSFSLKKQKWICI